MDVEFAVLGELRVLIGGIDVTPHAPKERALLALLAIDRGRVVSVDRLLEGLWPDLPPERGRRVLQVRVAELRQRLTRAGAGGLLQSVTPGYRLQLGPETLDANRFETAVQVARDQAKGGDTVGSAATLRHALGLWRGEAYADAQGCFVVETEAARLEELRLEAIEARVAAELADGCHDRLVPELDALVAAHPLREGLWEQRVLALYRCGRQADALRACAAVRSRLRDELGVEPGHGLRTVETAVLAQQPSLDWTPTHTARRVIPDPFPPRSGVADSAADRRDGVGYTGPVPEVRYAKTSDGVHLAYQVVGEGPPDIVLVPGYVSELDNWWEAWSGRLVRRLAGFSRLIIFDKRGMGLSDRPPRFDIEDWVQDIRTVIDRVEAERPAVVGVSGGGLVAVLFAATYPERIGPLVLYGAFARALTDPADDYPATDTVEELDELLARFEADWGSGLALDFFCPSVAGDLELRANFGQYQRRSASPGAATQYLKTVLCADVRYALPLISAPTLVLHGARDEAPPIELARYMAEHIPGAVLHELDTADHLIWFSEAIDTITDEIQDFVIGAIPAAETNRLLSTIVAVRTVESGLDVAERVVERYRGHTIERTTDALVAAFDGATRAVRCAAAMVIEIETASVGVHAGECSEVGDTLQGDTVSLARRVVEQAGPADVLVSESVRELVMGSSLEFNDRGSHALHESLPDWHLYALQIPVT